MRPSTLRPHPRRQTVSPRRARLHPTHLPVRQETSSTLRTSPAPPNRVAPPTPSTPHTLTRQGRNVLNIANPTRAAKPCRPDDAVYTHTVARQRRNVLNIADLTGPPRNRVAPRVRRGTRVRCPP